MLRGILFHLIPLLLPFIVYGVYLYFNKRAGGEKTWQGKSVAIATIFGLILMGASLITLAILRDDTKEGVYTPARFEDGKIIEPQFIPSEKK
ncbi:DUF6111 family protein [Sneathiella aquimaris]|uniref:DUF6111 family protein n=1 Tax=Sneathiella aquimaris TaxID=2599305 RepID=UPI00146E1910|nr:DUF6111 family protein [Sneathiella aquimaris]